PAILGKPVGQDLLLGRPSAAQELGLDGAVIHFDRLIDRAISSIPPCPGEALLRSLVLSEARRLVPSEGPAGVQRPMPVQTATPGDSRTASVARTVREH
ncbi:MAG: geranylgeranyl pyrophosphate synthase, partial [Betaproteobacteria bacterium]